MMRVREKEKKLKCNIGEVCAYVLHNKGGFMWCVIMHWATWKKKVVFVVN